VEGDITASALDVTGNVTISGNAEIAGDLTFGNMPEDTVTFVADVDSHIVPNTSGTYDLGSLSYP
jgi:hypothetical protein